MFQITNSSYRFRKKTLQAKTTEIQDNSSLGKTQSNKIYLKSFRANQNYSLNLSLPKNLKVLPKLQKTFNYPVYPPYPNRYIQIPSNSSNQASMAKYSFTRSHESQQNRNIFFRSEKNRRFQRLSDPKIKCQLNYTSVIDKDNCPKYYALNRKGKRPYNQDRFICKNGIHKLYLKNHLKKQNQYEQQMDLYSVFDGHGGSGCAEYLKDNFFNFLIRCKNLDTNPEQSLKQAFNQSQQKFIQVCQQKKFANQTSGACAISCLVTDSKVVVASVGDCRAIMFNRQFLCEMTKDHKPTQINQKMRIIRSGGKIFKEQRRFSNLGSGVKVISVTRIAPGNLNVSRTIGDIQTKLKKYGGLPGMISPEPQIKTFQKQNYEILLLASDGLFEAFSNSQIQRFYYKIVQSEMKNQLSFSELAKKFIDKLMDQAQIKSTDNITIIVVPLISHNCKES